MAIFQKRRFDWVFTANDSISQPWTFLTASNQAFQNSNLTIASLPVGSSRAIGYIDMGNDISIGAGDWARSRDWLTINLAVGNNATYNLNLKGVEYVDADLGKNIFLNSVGPTGFTTNGSLSGINMATGNQVLTYVSATKNSTVAMGAGFDTVRLVDNPLSEFTQYWAVIRRANGNIDAYNLETGFKVLMAGGGVTFKGLGANKYINYGEIEQIQMLDYNQGQGDILRTYNPGTQLLKGVDGGRALFRNIDLASAVDSNDTTVTVSTDSFNYAYFNHIRYTTNNLYVGQSTIYSNSDNRFSAVTSQSDHGTHDLIVGEQSTAINGNLRLYVSTVASALYNQFNRVYLGDATAESATINSAATVAGRAALYGFGGNDTLEGGFGDDYLFGGTSQDYNIRTLLQGNRITGGQGADYFGVGHLNTAGAMVGTGTDVILDWQAGLDSLRVLSNGVAIIDNVYDAQTYASQSIDVANVFDLNAYRNDELEGGTQSRSIINGDATPVAPHSATSAGYVGTVLNDTDDLTVQNEGLIVARGRGGNDTLYGSSGNDYLYGNEGTNTIDIGPDAHHTTGGNDRVYYDQFDGARSRHYVTGFTISTGLAADRDLFYLNKDVVDSFYAAGQGRLLTTQDVNGAYTGATSYNPGINYLHDAFYNPAFATSNANHNSADGVSFFSNPGGTSGADGKSSLVGLGMIIAGRALFAIPFVGPIIGAALIAAGTVLEIGSMNSTAHQNATYDGDVSGYMNVIYQSNGANIGGAGTGGVAPSFLSFFQGSNANDGFAHLVEFTHANVRNGGIYSYFALRSATDTYVYLVASRDNLVENSETFLIAKINGQLTAADFVVYDGDTDIYNASNNEAVQLLEPVLTSIKDSAGTPDFAFSSSSVTNDLAIANATAPILISGNISGTLTDYSYLRLYDGGTVIYDGLTPANGDPDVSLQMSGSNFVFSDGRGLGTTVSEADDDDNTLNFTDSNVTYTIEWIDGSTGIPSRTSSDTVTIGGGNVTINGFAGDDTLTLSETSDFLNGLSNDRLLNVESILLTNSDSADSAPINLNLSNQSDGFSIFSGSAGDTLIGSSGADTIAGGSGADSIHAGLGNDTVVFSSEFDTGGNGMPIASVVRTAAAQLVGDVTTIGGNGTDTLRFDTDFVDSLNNITPIGLTLVDTDFNKVTQFEAIDFTGTGNIDLTLGTKANSAFASGLTLTVNPDANSLTLDASSVSWTRSLNVTGTDSNDLIKTGSAYDVIDTGFGSDWVYSSTGGDQIDMGTGDDYFALQSLSHTGWTVDGLSHGSNDALLLNSNAVSSLSNTNSADLSSDSSIATVFGLIALDGMNSTGQNLAGSNSGTGITDGNDASDAGNVAGWLDYATHDGFYGGADVLVFADGTGGSDTYLWRWTDGGSGDVDVSELTLIGVFLGVEEAEVFLANNVFLWV